MTPEKLAEWMIKEYSITLDSLYIMRSISGIVVLNLRGQPTVVDRSVYKEIIKQLTHNEA